MTYPQAKVFDFSEIQRGPTTWLFEGGRRSDAGVSMFIVRTRPGRAVELLDRRV